MACVPDAKKWPWCDEWTPGACNNYELELERACAVGLFPADVSSWLVPEGSEVYDLAGNVAEWCCSRFADYDNDYPRRTPDQRLDDPEGTEGRVVRGGAWDSSSWGCRASGRNGDGPTYANYVVGFRVVCLSPRP